MTDDNGCQDPGRPDSGTPDPGTPEQQTEIKELQKKGWQVESIVQGMALHRHYPSFSETLNYLIELGDLTAELDAMPSIHIDGGTEVKVRVGSEPAPGLTADEIRLAQALSAA